ncbi:CehA/McbA family metallohydrolase [Amycolatopsis cynarae]|uniref:CehA/McbA family metallohydrolase n=1 Tax=Amycolatopsis cynarae TaxID=2995223 RepID=A0ABY7B305_9PSEU|nr:CehA/McbA family metallohydrolase [Amycolatopsis sp. HUAS 11-8]WAL66685.1 CehA/McbA family metallohydrolase [Amycolatopsis sp. HUAS 11-8]
MCMNCGAGVSRRGFLTAAGVGAGMALAPVAFAEAAEGQTETKVITGHFEPGTPDFVYLPVQVPSGVSRISAVYSYDKPPVPAGTPGNSCDIGVFDARGTQLGGAGFRGWSGGFRDRFSISRSEATPGYLPGEVMPGTWNIVLGPYQIAPQGMDYRVEVTLTYGPPGPAYQPDYPPVKAAGRGRAWYRGDCHLHTVYSDGRRLPAEVAAGARDAKLDFITSTDHNTSSSHGVWGPLAGDDLLIMLGEEVTTRNGHWLALGVRPGQFIDWRYRSQDHDLPEFQREVHRSNGLCVAAHPYCPWIGCNFKFGYQDFDAVEVWNGPWTWDDDAAVSTWDGKLVEAVRGGGRWLPAMGNSDAHNPGNVIGLPQNVVLADELSRDAILDGIKAGRTWIAESSAVELSFAAAGPRGQSAGIGERLAVGKGDKVAVRLDVKGVPNGTVRLITDEGQLLQQSLPANGEGTVTWLTTPAAAAYVRAEVRHPQADGSAGAPALSPGLNFGAMAAMTNPIFLGRS